MSALVCFCSKGVLTLMRYLYQCSWQLERTSVPQLAASLGFEFAFSSCVCSRRRQHSQRLFNNGRIASFLLRVTQSPLVLILRTSQRSQTKGFARCSWTCCRSVGRDSAVIHSCQTWTNHEIVYTLGRLTRSLLTGVGIICGHFFWSFCTSYQFLICGYFGLILYLLFVAVWLVTTDASSAVASASTTSVGTGRAGLLFVLEPVAPVALHIISRPDQGSTVLLCSARCSGVENPAMRGNDSSAELGRRVRRHFEVVNLALPRVPKPAVQLTEVRVRYVLRDQVPVQ